MNPSVFLSCFVFLTCLVPLTISLYNNRLPITNVRDFHADVGVNRIVNGAVVFPKDKYSFIGSLRLSNIHSDSHSCGVSLIASNVALTAAHCVLDAEDVFVVFGDHYHLDEDPFSAIEVINIEIHEDYNDTQVHNDIALLQLKDDVNSTMYNMITLLNGTGMIDMESYEGSLSVAGWGVVDNKVGAEESRILLETTVDFQSPDYCDNYLNSEGFLTRFTLANYDNTGKICTVGNGTGICAGDSGGPLFYTTSLSDPQYIQVGIISFDYECGGVDHPTIYTDVSYYFGWIQSKLCSDENPLSPNSTLCADLPLREVLPPATSSIRSYITLSEECSDDMIMLDNNEELAKVEAENSVPTLICDADVTLCSAEYLAFVREIEDVCTPEGEDEIGQIETFDYEFECKKDDGDVVIVELTDLTYCVGLSCTSEEITEYYDSRYTTSLNDVDGLNDCAIVSGGEFVGISFLYASIAAISLWTLFL